MPTVAIYFSDPDVRGYPFNAKFIGEQFIEVYSWLSRDLRAAGIDVYIVRGNSYLGDGCFASGWILADSKFTAVADEINADLIFNRDDKNTIPYIDDCKVVNHPDFDNLCVDKLATVEAFPVMSPLTARLTGFADFEARSDEFGDELVVLKKNFDSSGRGIFILPANQVSADLYPDWDGVLLQEFLDSSMGIPGVVEGYHDLRVTVVNGQPANAFLRIPAEGSLLANISLGGSGRELELSDVPDQVMDYVKDVVAFADQKYKPYIFSADFMNTQKGYKLIELNSRPGLLHPDFTKNWEVFNRMVTEMLIAAVLPN